jgi:quercetin dioxygenase-like cupin family protein/DNA-binding XRE family transcriptional regulator
LGARIRAARQKRQVGVRELGRQIGVTGSLISQIESGKVLPSVTTLFSVMSALDIPVTEMLGDVADAPAAPAPAPAPRPSARAEPGLAEPVMLAAADQPVVRLGSGVTWHVLNPSGDDRAEFLRVIYEPGASSSGHGRGMLVHAGREYGVVISGRLTVTVQSEGHELGPGDTISFDASHAHRLSNDGDEPVVAIWFIRLDAPA